MAEEIEKLKSGPFNPEIGDPKIADSFRTPEGARPEKLSDIPAVLILKASARADGKVGVVTNDGRKFIVADDSKPKVESRPERK
jgi:hypothetical protein